MPQVRARQAAAVALAVFLAASVPCAVCLATPAYAHAKDTNTLGKAWRGSYYRYLGKTRYVVLTLKKNSASTTLFAEDGASVSLSRGYYKTWSSEGMASRKGSKLIRFQKSPTLCCITRRAHGKKIVLEPVKNIWLGKGALLNKLISKKYMCGVYYKTLKDAKARVTTI